MSLRIRTEKLTAGADLVTRLSVPAEIECGISEEELAEIVAAGAEFTGFRGAVGPVDSAILDDPVPEGFPHRTILDEDGTERVMTWREYAYTRTSLDGESCLILTGERHGQNFDDRVDSAVLGLYIEEFGLEAIRTLSRSREILREPPFTADEEE